MDFSLFTVKNVPSVVTILALVTSFSGCFILINDGDISSAILLVWLAGLFDTLDGWLARLLDACSEFGKELDSIADMVSFGVSPSLIIGLTLKGENAFGFIPVWIYCLFFASCIAVRLARFNVKHVGQSAWKALYFTGVPAPASSFITFFPYNLHLSGYGHLINIGKEGPCANLMACWLIFCGIIAVSNLRTWSLKSDSSYGKQKGRRRADMRPAFSVVLVVIFYLTYQMGVNFTMALVIVSYMFTWPVSSWKYYDRSRREKEMKARKSS